MLGIGSDEEYFPHFADGKKWHDFRLWMEGKRYPKGKTDLVILDVRQPREWAGGHISGAMFITGAELPERLTEVPKNRPVAVICGSGYRSTVAASLLKNQDYRRIATVMGGMNAWVKAGLPTVSE